MSEHRERLISAYVRIALRYIIAGVGGVWATAAEDPDLVFALTGTAMLLLEGAYLRDWKRRGEK